MDTADRDAEIARLYRTGRALAALGTQFNISKERVRQILAQRDVPRRSIAESMRGRGTPTPEQCADIIGRHERGATIVAIAAALGLSPERVSAALHAAGRDTTNRRYRNRPGLPRTCTCCLRTEGDGAVFSPGATANRCRECVAAATRAWYRKNTARKLASDRRRRGRPDPSTDAPGRDGPPHPAS